MSSGDLFVAETAAFEAHVLNVDSPVRELSHGLAMCLYGPDRDLRFPDHRCPGVGHTETTEIGGTEEF